MSVNELLWKDAAGVFRSDPGKLERHKISGKYIFSHCVTSTSHSGINELL